MFKKVLKAVLIGIGAVVACALLLVLLLTVTEFKPDASSAADMVGSRPVRGEAGKSLTILSWNLGYGGLGEEADFFMDGGESVRSERADVENNLDGISEYLSESQADIYLLQEVDEDSKRSYGIDQREALCEALDINGDFALNYKCLYVPYPLPTIGRVKSGVLTLTNYEVADARRISLPCPFSWPVSAANLKRCLLVSYIELEGTDKQLVIVNLHLEAYDSGEGKAAQTKALKEFLLSQYEKGNYVIAGGDFNQTFPGALEDFPIKNAELWTPGVLEEDELPEGWRFAWDSAAPTCRLLNQPYDREKPENAQFYVIDGFILSPNVELGSVETGDCDFQFSDHNPVKLEVTLK